MTVFGCFLVPTARGTKRQFTADGKAISSEEVPPEVYRKLKCKAQAVKDLSRRRILSVSVTNQTGEDCRNVKGKKEPLIAAYDPGCRISKKEYLEFYKFLSGDVLLENRLQYDTVDRVYADYSSTSLGDVCANLLNEVGNPCLQGWTFEKKLGQGAFGAVFRVRRGSERAAVKFMIPSDRYFTSVENEVQMQKLFASYGLGPQILCYTKVYVHSNELHVILMEPIDFTLFKLVCQHKVSTRTIEKIGDAIESIMVKLNKLGFTHGDMHSKNLGFVRQPDGRMKMMFIDFGQSSTQTNNPVVDAEQLLSELKEIQRASPRIVSHIESVLNGVVHRINPAYGRLKGTRQAFKKAHRAYEPYIGKGIDGLSAPNQYATLGLRTDSTETSLEAALQRAMTKYNAKHGISASATPEIIEPNFKLFPSDVFAPRRVDVESVPSLIDLVSM